MVKEVMTWGEANALFDVLKAICEPTRLRLLSIFCIHGECNVGTICAQLDIAQGTISSHLRVMRQAQIIHARKAGTSIFYSINVEAMREVIGQVERLVSRQAGD